MFQLESKSRFVLILAVLVVCGQFVNAQPSEKLERKWLAHDIKNLSVLSHLSPENSTKEKLSSAFGDETHNFDFEFGAKGYSNGKSGGYTIITVTVRSFHEKQISFQITVSASRSSWQLIRIPFIEAWKERVRLPFRETDRGIIYEVVDQGVLETYKTAIAEIIGKPQTLSIPDDLKEDYDFLTAPFVEIDVSEERCGYGLNYLPGKVAIDRIIKENRVDIVASILRGYNHGGRVIAAIALLKLKKQGHVLEPITEQTLQKVLNLDLAIISCAGCISFPTTAKSLVSEYRLQ